MRNVALVLAALLALAWAPPAFAGGGLPHLGDLHAGPYRVALYNDSPGLVVGRNALTLELPAGVDPGGVRLVLLSARGETLTVSMSPVTVFGAADEAHAAEMSGTTGMADMPGMTGTSHGHAPVAAVSKAESATLRGSVQVPRDGPWRATLSVVDDSGGAYAAEMPLDAVAGGPNGLYLLTTGSLIGSALCVGIATRRARARRLAVRER